MQGCALVTAAVFAVIYICMSGSQTLEMYEQIASVKLGLLSFLTSNSTEPTKTSYMADDFLKQLIAMLFTHSNYHCLIFGTYDQ